MLFAILNKTFGPINESKPTNVGFFMQHDVLIVGFGLAGWALTEMLKQEGKSFVVFDPQKESSSSVATGIYNPVVLKRFTAINRAQELMDYSIPFYARNVHANLLHNMPIHRVFATAAEQNKWAEASDKPALRAYLHDAVLANALPYIKAPNGLGEMQQTGWINTMQLLTNAHQRLTQDGFFVSENFDYASLVIKDDGVQYKEWRATQIIFAEGVGVKHNPWFSELPVIPNKGEWLVVLCKGLQLKHIIKGSVFIVPLGNDTYRVGATYARVFEDLNPTAQNKAWLVAQFKKYVSLPFEVVSHGAGLRPTVTDRKPIIGKHPQYPQLSCVNGLGSRGVLWAPFLAKLLIGRVFDDAFVPNDLCLSRFMPS